MGTLKPSLSGATVDVNSSAAYQKDAYFRRELSVTNSTDPVLQSIAIEADLSSTIYDEDREQYVAETPEAYTYDDDGNLLTDGKWEYTWNAGNRLVTMTTQADAVTAGVTDLRLEFLYDGSGRRVQKEVWDDTTTPALVSRTRFIYDGWNMVAEVGKEKGERKGVGSLCFWVAEFNLRLPTPFLSPQQDYNGGHSGRSHASWSQKMAGGAGEMECQWCNV